MSRNDTGAYAVILTGGALPGEARGAPPAYQVDIALERAGCEQASGTLARRIADAAWQAGYAEAAKLHRVAAAYVLDGKDDACRFAGFVTREIDPAYVTAARSPLDELLAAAGELRCRDQADADGAS